VGQSPARTALRGETPGRRGLLRIGEKVTGEAAEESLVRRVDGRRGPRSAGCRKGSCPTWCGWSARGREALPDRVWRCRFLKPEA
jgi:hypothetical protein